MGTARLLETLEKSRGSKPPFHVRAVVAALAEAGELSPVAREAVIDALDVLAPGQVPTALPVILATCGAEPEEIVPALLELTGGLEAAAAAGGDLAAALDFAVRQGSTLPTPELRWEAIRALESLGAAANSAGPALEEMAGNGDPTTRYLARRALRRIGSDR
jgi:hypothetical protein